METKLVPSAELTVNEIIHRFPAAVRVFHRFGIDACCGGALPLTDAAARHGRSSEELLEALREVVAAE